MKGNEEFVADSMTQSVFSLRLRWSLFLVKLEVIPIIMKTSMNGSEEVCARVCFW